jgi:hypothetical protein
MKWQYHFSTSQSALSEESLNHLGQEGWQLVSHFHNHTTINYHYIFIRPETEVLPSFPRYPEDME